MSAAQLALVLGLLALLLAAAALVLRRVLISRRGGVVECCLRYPARSARSRRLGSWLHGLAEFHQRELHWHRSLSWRFRPRAVFRRSDLRIARSRAPTAAEIGRLGPGLVIVTCEVQAVPARSAPRVRVVELALSQDALTGLLAWLEAAPLWYVRRG
ncbi:MAG: DUF2550 family protein [Streptosporangiaceae bacterium]